MKFLALYCCALSLVGGGPGPDEERMRDQIERQNPLTLSHGGVHQISVPRGTLVVIIECSENLEHRKFVDCMRGPPYLCAPTRYKPDGSIVGWVDKTDFEVATAPAYVCLTQIPSCWMFDRDWDGDVDLYDWALWTARDWGVRASKKARTP